MTPEDFIAKWRGGGDERRDAQPFFEDLCRLIGHPTPREADPEHTWFTYEYGAEKTSGGDGWADVWKKDFFGWEAKGTHKNLDRAYEQLKMYADALNNPPLLVVSDLRTIIIHTNFTNTVKTSITITIDQLTEYSKRCTLEAVFNNPSLLKPKDTPEGLTRAAAEKFTQLAQALRDRGHGALPVAHFLNRLLFSMFAEDIKLLPNNLFTKLVESSQGNPDIFDRRCRELFGAMSKGGDIAFENVDWFNGGLFDDDATLPLTSDELKILLSAAKLDWSGIDPSIFGTLFERGMDPDKRSQLGAHYTDPKTIMKIVDPVVVEPWRRDWEIEKAALVKLIHSADRRAQKSGKDRVERVLQRVDGLGRYAPFIAATPLTQARVPRSAFDRFNAFLERLKAFTVLDPACGSGNFLFLSLRALKDIEKRVLLDAEALGLGRQFPAIGPRCVKGIEINAYAAELARITIWIGEIQWMIQNGYGAKKNPILQPMDQIENRDALVNADGTRAEWPVADVVVGNPPFVGDKKMQSELGTEYVEVLRKAYVGQVPGGADLVCYWFEKANDALRAGVLKRAGLVATNSIRGGRNREVLKHITNDHFIFEAWSDEAWINEGAAVRVSIVCFANQRSQSKLDNEPVETIFADLSAAQSEGDVDLTLIRRMKDNARQGYVGIQKTGPFEVSGETARKWLALPNPNGRSNCEVVRPWFNGLDVTRRNRDMWIVDFGTDISEQDAAMYEAPFEYVREVVRPTRVGKREQRTNECWWLFQWPRPVLRKALKGLSRYIVTPEVSKHRVFSFLDPSIVADKNLTVIAREDDVTFGILQSRFHELWALRTGTSLEDRPRYTPSTCFETFPFPEGLTPTVAAEEFANNKKAQAIAAAAKALVEARDRWLNPLEWTDRVKEVSSVFPDRIVAKSGHAAELKRRTITNLYNDEPVWLSLLHDALNKAVAEAYEWSWPMADNDIIAKLFGLNQRSASRP